MKPRTIMIFALAGSLIVGSACSSSSDSSPSTTPQPSTTDNAVSGPADDHCSGQPVGVSDPNACTTPVGAGSAGDSSAGGDSAGGATGGAADCNLVHDAAYGDTLYNSSGDDDDCKYHASWTSTPIAVNKDVTFTVTVTSIADKSPLEGLKSGQNALSRVELYVPCSPTHFPPAQDFRPTIRETAPGVYTAGPMRFDQSGRWVVRFHFDEECLDQETSPHGHIAFFVDVP